MKKSALGKMRHRLTVLAVERVPDGAGGFARQDLPSIDVWARVMLMSAREVSAYAELQQRASHRVIARTNPDIREGVTLVWHWPGGDVPLYVEAVAQWDQDGRPGEFIAAICRQGGNL